MKSLLLLLLLSIGVPAMSQELIWQKSYGGEQDETGEAILPTNGGGYIVAGATRSIKSNPSAIWSAYFVRLGPDGEAVWERAVSSYYYTKAYGIYHLSETKYIAIGYAMESPNTRSHIWVATLDIEGNLISERLVGEANTDVRRIRRTSDNGFILTGIAGGTHMCATKLDPLGNVEWQRSYQITEDDGSGSFSIGEGARELANGDFAIVGTVLGYPFPTPPLIRISPRGDSLWALSLGTDSTHFGGDVIEQADGTLLVVGTRRPSLTSATPAQAYIAKVTSSGAYLSSYTHAAGQQTGFDVIEPMADRGFITAGRSGEDTTHTYVARMNFNGDLITGHSYPFGAQRANARAILPLPDGGCIVVGTGGKGILVTRLAGPSSGVDEAAPIPKIMGIW